MLQIWFHDYLFEISSKCLLLILKQIYFPFCFCFYFFFFFTVFFPLFWSLTFAGGYIHTELYNHFHHYWRAHEKNPIHRPYSKIVCVCVPLFLPLRNKIQSEMKSNLQPLFLNCPLIIIMREMCQLCQCLATSPPPLPPWPHLDTVLQSISQCVCMHA